MKKQRLTWGLIAASLAVACSVLPPSSGTRSAPAGLVAHLEATNVPAQPGSTGAAAAGTRATLTILWPARSVQSMPSNTSAINFWASQNGTILAQATVTRPSDAATSSVTLPSDPSQYLPLGQVTFGAFALDSTGYTLASATASATMVENRVTAVSLTFTVSATPTPSPSPSPTAPTPSPSPSPSPSPTPSPSPSQSPTPTPSSTATPLTVSTFAGIGVQGFANGPGPSAAFAGPWGVAVDSSGNVYVADDNNNRIRKITPAGVVSTVAGDGTPGDTDGLAASAEFAAPEGVAVDATGSIYVADRANNKIRKISTNGIVSTIAANSTPINYPYGVAVDTAGNVYVANEGDYNILKISPAGVVTTLAGNGVSGFADDMGTAAEFGDPYGVAVDSAGNVYVADAGNSRIRKITPEGKVTTVAGNGSFGWADGIGTAAKFNYPTGVAVDANGNLYVADLSNRRIRKINTAGVVSTLAGDGTQAYLDAVGTAAEFSVPRDVAVDLAGNLFVSDMNNYVIRNIAGE